MRQLQIRLVFFFHPEKELWKIVTTKATGIIANHKAVMMAMGAPNKPGEPLSLIAYGAASEIACRFPNKSPTTLEARSPHRALLVLNLVACIICPPVC